MNKLLLFNEFHPQTNLFIKTLGGTILKILRVKQRFTMRIFGSGKMNGEKGRKNGSAAKSGTVKLLNSYVPENGNWTRKSEKPLNSLCFHRASTPLAGITEC